MRAVCNLRRAIYFHRSCSDPHTSIDILSLSSAYINTVIDIISTINPAISNPDISRAMHVMDPSSIFDIVRFDDRISCDIFRSCIDHRTSRDVDIEIMELPFIVQDFCLLYIIHFFWKLFISDAVLLILQVVTSYTFLTSHEIRREPYVRRISNIATIEDIVGVRDTSTHVDIRAILAGEKRIIYIRHARIAKGAISDIFDRIHDSGRKIDIFSTHHDICEVAILRIIPDMIHRLKGHYIVKRLDLCEK